VKYNIALKHTHFCNHPQSFITPSFWNKNKVHYSKNYVCLLLSPFLNKLPLRLKSFIQGMPGDPGSNSDSNSACPWLWSEGTLQAYWPVSTYDLILAIPSVLTCNSTSPLSLVQCIAIHSFLNICTFCKFRCPIVQYYFALLFAMLTTTWPMMKPQHCDMFYFAWHFWGIWRWKRKHLSKYRIYMITAVPIPRWHKAQHCKSGLPFAIIWSYSKPDHNNHDTLQKLWIKILSIVTITHYYVLL